MSEENACVVNHQDQERRKATVQGSGTVTVETQSLRECQSVLGKPNTKGTATCEGKQRSGGKWVGENEV